MSSVELSGPLPLAGRPFPTPHSQPVVLRVFDRRRSPFRRRQVSGGERVLPSRVDALLESDAAHQKHLRNVRSKQRALKVLVTRAGWLAYLELEEAEFHRWAHAVDRVARWALERGRRGRGRR